MTDNKIETTKKLLNRVRLALVVATAVVAVAEAVKEQRNG